MTKVRMEGSWPGHVVLRRGWARAESRPWNDAVPMAHLRLVRGGGSSFIDDCVETLLALGITAVLSPPLPRSARTAWEAAGFDLCADLTLMRRTLDRIPPPSHLVLSGGSDDVTEALRIDAAAFEDFWQFDDRALEEAMEATSSSVLHVVRSICNGWPSIPAGKPRASGDRSSARPLAGPRRPVPARSCSIPRPTTLLPLGCTNPRDSTCSKSLSPCSVGQPEARSLQSPVLSLQQERACGVNRGQPPTRDRQPSVTGKPLPVRCSVWRLETGDRRLSGGLLDQAIC